MSSFPTLVFVYGTLLRGENNYPYWLADEAEAVFISRARTVDRYPLFVIFPPQGVDCSPCVLDLPNCDVRGCVQVEGELFAVSDKMKAWLDVLEDISGGTYVSVPTAIEVCEAPSASYRKRAGSIPFTIPCPTTATPAEPPVVTAALYFRAKNYPSDWATPSPTSSSKLLAKFSAAEMLRTYGQRFNGGLPAHLRGGPSGVTAVAMQKQLNALPQSYWPPSTLAYYAMAERHPNVPTPSHGAPLFPKPMVLFIIDGVGDNTYCELGRRTPLEVVAGVPAVTVPATSRDSNVFPVTEEVPPVKDADLSNGATVATLRETVNTHVTPGINVVTQHGVSGLMDPYMAGKSCGSDTAHLSMFGYPPTAYYRGRGAYEALGAGLELEDEDVAFKSNFSTFADPEEEVYNEDPELEARAVATTAPSDQYVTHRRCDRDFTHEGPLLCQDLNGMTVPCDLAGVPFDYPHVIKVQYATEHRCGVALSGARCITHEDGTTKVLGMLSDKITGTDPLRDRHLLLHCKPTVAEDHPEYAAALYTCRLVEAASAALTKRLKAHPINEARRQHNRSLATAAAAQPEHNQGGTINGASVARKNIANLILFRGAAKKGWVPTFAVRHGLHGLILAPTCIIKGLGICCGLHGEVCAACDPTGQASLRGATGDYHSDLMVKVRAASHALRIECPATHESAVAQSLAAATTAEQVSRTVDPHYNFVAVHVKGVDDAGHDKNLTQKLEMLHRAGLAMEALWTALPSGSTVAVIADHSTPLGVGDHSCEPVPVSIAVKGTPREGGDGASAGPCDSVQFYSEVLAASGALGRFRGDELIALMKHVHHHYHYA